MPQPRRPLNAISDNTNVRSLPQTKPDQDALLSRLQGAHVLVVEDEALIAMDLEYALQDKGVNVIGPASNLKSTMQLVSTGAQIDAAILDIDLGGEDVFPAAAILTQRGVPFVFHTGHGLSLDVGAMFPDAGLCIKPMNMHRLLSEIAYLLPPRDDRV